MVISGPDATAGSILIFLKNIGITQPIIAEIKIETSNAPDKQAEVANAICNPFPFAI